MAEIFLKTLPFFALIGLGYWAGGYWAGRSRFFSAEATAYLTKFVFYFALPAMLLRFSASLTFAEIINWPLIAAYSCATFSIYLIATIAALLRRLPFEEVVIEAQCAVIGNTGFLGVPMLVLLLGDAAISPVILVLAIDLIVFSSLFTILISGHRDGRLSIGILRSAALGLVKNPMVVAMALGLAWAALAVPIPGPVDEFLTLLGGAATPGALFAIGAALAGKSTERLIVAGWLSFCKLALHPAAVALAVLVVFPVDRFSAGVVIAAASLPVAGNVYILAAQYNVAPARVSASILVSTLVSILSVSIIIAWVFP